MGEGKSLPWEELKGAEVTEANHRSGHRENRGQSEVGSLINLSRAYWWRKAHGKYTGTCRTSSHSLTCCKATGKELCLTTNCWLKTGKMTTGTGLSWRGLLLLDRQGVLLRNILASWLLVSVLRTNPSMLRRSSSVVQSTSDYFLKVSLIASTEPAFWSKCHKWGSCWDIQWPKALPVVGLRTEFNPIVYSRRLEPTPQVTKSGQGELSAEMGVPLQSVDRAEKNLWVWLFLLL